MNWTGGKCKRKSFHSTQKRAENRKNFFKSTNTISQPDSDAIKDIARQFFQSDATGNYENAPSKNYEKVPCNKNRPNHDLLMMHNVLQNNSSPAPFQSAETFDYSSLGTGSLQDDNSNQAELVVQLIDQEIQTTNKKTSSPHNQVDTELLYLRKKILWLETMVIKMNDALQLLIKR